MKKLITILFSMTMAAMLFAGCTTNAPSETGAPPKTDDAIRIGVNYELSGVVATYGQSSVDGIELAVNEINAAGGVTLKDGTKKPIKMIKYDTKSEQAEATSLATKLMTQDKVVAVLGPATSGSFKATVPVAMQNKIPVASGSATADDVTVDNTGLKEYAFRICFSDSYQGTAMASFAAENLSAKKAVIIMDSSSDYGKGLAENFEKKFIADGGEIVATESYVEKDTDFNAILTSIRGKSFDVIFIPGYYNEAGLIIKQARALGIDAPIIGADGFDSPILMELAGAEALNKVYYSNHYSSLDKNPLVIQFIEDYQGKYNKEPDAFNALGYDLAKFVADGISRAESLSGEAVKTALAQTTNFEGVTGSFSVDKNHNPVKDIVVVSLTDGVPTSTVTIKAGE